MITRKQCIYLGISILLWLGVLAFKGIWLGEAKIRDSYTPPQEITVTMYALRPGGANTGFECTVDDPTTPTDEADIRYGCQPDVDNPGGVLRYPYTTNPVTISIENDYLLDVVPREMGPAVYPFLPALTAQAIVARSYAYCAIHAWAMVDEDSLDYWSGCLRNINNSNEFQVFIPGYFDTLTTPQQNLILAAVADYGYLVAPAYPEEGPLFAEFSADAFGQTQDGGNYSYLRGVADPISTGCDANDFGHGHGMSQEGAARWANGNQCANPNEGDEPWSVIWPDPRLIAFHYFREAQLLDENGNPKAGVDRWNLFSHTIPPQVENNQTYTVTLALQNTSLVNWTGDVVLGYRWTAPGASPYEDEAGWQVVSEGLVILTSQQLSQTVPLITPAQGGTYTLHWDVARQGEGLTWFGAETGEDYAPWPHWEQPITVTSSGPPTATPNPTNPSPSATATPWPTTTPQPSPTQPPATGTPIPIPPTPTPTQCVAQVALSELSLSQEIALSHQLYALRDDFLATQPGGQAYIDLYYTHSPELARLLLNDATLRTQAQSLMTEMIPFIQPLTSDEAEAVPLTPTQVNRIDTFLATLQTQARPALAAEIDWWRAQRSLWVDATIFDIWPTLLARTLARTNEAGLDED